MRRLSTILRWFLVVILVPIVPPVAKHFIDSWIERKGFYAHPDQAAGWFGNLIVAIAQAPGVAPAAIFFVGLTLGVWLDWLVRKFDDSRATKRREIGLEFEILADTVERRAQGFRVTWPECVNDSMPKIASAFLMAKKIGIWTPGSNIYQDPRGAGFLVSYLRAIGTFLVDGHFNEAKSTALDAKRELEKITNG